MSSKLGRFIQPDPIIPGFTKSQAWNRFAYVFNNPINFVDPTGHAPLLDGNPDAYEEWATRALNHMLADAYQNHGISVGLDSSLTLEEKITFMSGLKEITDAASNGFIDKHLRGGAINVEKGAAGDSACGRQKGATIFLMTENPRCSNKNWQATALHEIFHFVDWRSGWDIGKAFEGYIGASTEYKPYISQYSGEGFVWKELEVYDVGSERPPIYGGSIPPNRRGGFC